MARSVTIRAAWIGAAAVVLAAVIQGLFSPFGGGSEQEATVSASPAGPTTIVQGARAVMIQQAPGPHTPWVHGEEITIDTRILRGSNTISVPKLNVDGSIVGLHTEDKCDHIWVRQVAAPGRFDRREETGPFAPGEGQWQEGE